MNPLEIPPAGQSSDSQPLAKPLVASVFDDLLTTAGFHESYGAQIQNLFEKTWLLYI